MKHHEAGLPEQLPTDTLSQIDYWHTGHCEDYKEVYLCQRTTHMHMAEWKKSPPMFQNTPLPLTCVAQSYYYLGQPG